MTRLLRRWDKRSPQRSMRHVLVLAAAGVVCLLAVLGCAGTRAAAEPVPPSTAPSSTAVVCIDVTTSIPRSFVAAAKEYMARQIEAAVAGPMGPATFYLRAVNSRSYSPEAELLTVRLPAAPQRPPAPVLPTNPYDEAERERLKKEYAAAVAAWDAQLAAAKQQAKAAADGVRDLPLVADHTGTDVWGCPLRAGELLGGNGVRMLFYIGDLVPDGPQQSRPMQLPGVEVIVAFWCDDTAEMCAQRREDATSRLTEAGAASVTYIDPQQIN